MTVAAVSQATIRQAVYQQQFDIAAQLIPQKELSAFSKMPAKDLSAQSKHVTHLLAQYPNDPRSYYLQAIIDNAKNDAIDASILLNKALTKLNGLKTVFPNHAFEKELRLFLAKTLIDQSKISQARLAVLPVCGSIKQGENQWLTSEWLATVCKN
jgi:hypothetical protein